jgi:hypothetical protein
VAFAALLWTAAARPCASPDLGAGAQPADTAADPLLELNQDFRRAYARARQDLLARGGPVLVVHGDTLILLRGGKRSEVRAVPGLYHTLKAVAHVPLAAYVLLATQGDGPLPAERLAELRTYRDRVERAAASLKGRDFTEDMRKRQRAIFTASLKFLDEVLAAKGLKAGALEAFARALAPLVLANAADAARAQIDGVNQQAKAWRAEMTPAEWKALRVLVLGPALPRERNVMVQYFARLLGERGEGGRITYTEGVFELPRALESLGTRLLDSRIGADFFGDERRMHRDLLSDAAETYLKGMKFEP